jgi:PTH1 family peptidyl-tRNA hydrolase
MRLVIVGLGNPGRGYSGTRHNAGFEVVDCMARRVGTPLKRRRRRNYAVAQALMGGRRLTLVQPLTYMNASGDVIKPVLAECDAAIDDLVVVCDTLDLDPGASRLRLAGSSAGNKGLASVLRVLGTEQVKRIYVGVGRPLPGVAVIDHVLSRPPAGAARAVAQAVDRVCSHLEVLLDGDYQRAMNLINQRGVPA